MQGWRRMTGNQPGKRSQACFNAAKHCASMTVPTLSAIISSLFGIGTAPRR
jgi:hypothetical protein